MLDRWAHAQWSPFTRGVSTVSLRMAFDDWATHLSHNPGEQLKLLQLAWQSTQQWLNYAVQSQKTDCKPCIEPLVHDTRFAHPTAAQLAAMSTESQRRVFSFADVESPEALSALATAAKEHGLWNQLLPLLKLVKDILNVPPTFASR